MLTDDDLEGIRKADPTARREIKVKLPYQQLLLLQFLKLRSHRTFSDVVEEALAQFFQEQGFPAQDATPDARAVAAAPA